MKKLQSIQNTKLIVMSIFVSIFFLSSTCDDQVVFSDVYLMNNSGETIYVEEFGFGDDTTLLSPIHAFGNNDMSYLEKIPIDGIFKGGVAIPTDGSRMNKYQIIIFKQSTIEKYSIEEMIDKNIFDKRYIFSTEKELRDINYIINYTGK